MTMKIEELTITGLHGYKDLVIPINDNRLILVGVNGLGKTTVVNILYFLLTKQWWRLTDYSFKQITVKIDQRRFKIVREQLVPNKKLLDEVANYFPGSIRAQIANDERFLYSLLSIGDRPSEIRRLSDRIGLPTSMIRRIKDSLTSSMKSNDLHLILAGGGQSITKLAEHIDENMQGEVLYLPTYRRIEQDLKAIFPHMEEDISSFSHQKDKWTSSEGRGHLELVQFGMEDVVEKVKKTVASLKESVRLELNNLAGSYLRDVIRNQADTYEKSVISSLSDEDVSKMLDRVDEKTLNNEDKRRISLVIKKVRTRNVELEKDTERYLAHYFSKLVDIYRSQQEKESSIRGFVDVCNKYLQGKSILYDDVNFTIGIFLDDESQIEMRSLSSGEKQIVSLFSHIYLGDPASYYALIDEPELSLSVEWQKTLLPDILHSGKCEFLLAVTHSPFIFDNELDNHAVDLKSCLR